MIESNPRASMGLWSADNIQRAWEEGQSKNMSNSPNKVQTESERQGKWLIQDTQARRQD